MKHQILKSEDIGEKCIYCSADMSPEKWKAKFSEHFTYKSAVCEKCSKENWIRIIHGSRHEHWTETIDSRVLEHRK